MTIFESIRTLYAALQLAPPSNLALATSTTVPQLPSTTETQEVPSLFGPDSIAYKNECAGSSHYALRQSPAVHEPGQTAEKHLPADLTTGLQPEKRLPLTIASSISLYPHAALHEATPDPAASPADAPNHEHTSKPSPNGASKTMEKKNSSLSENMQKNASYSIIRTVHDFIEEERRHSFCFLGRHLRQYMSYNDLLVVSRATRDEVDEVLHQSGHPLLVQYAEDDWYTFNEPRRDIPSHTVAITLAHGEDMAIENLAVCIPERDCEPRIVPADAWLRETHNWGDDWAMRFPKMQYDRQQSWWKNNGQSFRIFDLPLELREAIYLQMVGPVVLPDIHNGQVVIGTGLSYGHATRPGKFCDPDIERPNMTIMRVCKKFRKEASIVANRDTYKRLRAVARTQDNAHIRQPRHDIPSILASTSIIPPQAAFLRRIQLEMSAAAYFASINIVPRWYDPFSHEVGSFELRSLSQFPALQYLDFRFISPKHPGALCPWAQAAATDVHVAHACQKIWIDWFFTFACGTLEMLSAPNSVRYTLSGCVKTSTKAHWETLLQDVWADHEADIAAEEAKIRATSGPGKCKCSTACSRKEAGQGKACEFTESEIRDIEGLRGHVDDMYWRFED